jgi:hypothetical protein
MFDKYRLQDGSIYWHKLYFAMVPEWMTKYAPPLADYNYAAYLYQPHKYFMGLYDKAKWFMQRGYRGYSDHDVWNLDWYLATWMPEALGKLKNGAYCQPTGITKKGWNAKLDKMINAFKIARKIQNCDYNTPKKCQAAIKQFRRDFDLVRIHFFDLWD